MQLSHSASCAACRHSSGRSQPKFIHLGIVGTRQHAKSTNALPIRCGFACRFCKSTSTMALCYQRYEAQANSFQNANASPRASRPGKLDIVNSLCYSAVPSI